MPRYQRPTGTLDVLPEDQRYWHYVRARARHLAELSGFERKGHGVWVAFGDRGLKSQLREAGRRGVRYTVILGEDELAAGTAAVRDMQAGEQVQVALAGLVEWLEARLKAML